MQTQEFLTTAMNHVSILYDTALYEQIKTYAWQDMQFPVCWSMKVPFLHFCWHSGPQKEKTHLYVNSLSMWNWLMFNYYYINIYSITVLKGLSRVLSHCPVLLVGMTTTGFITNSWMAANTNWSGHQLYVISWQFEKFSRCTLYQMLPTALCSLKEQGYGLSFKV